MRPFLTFIVVGSITALTCEAAFNLLVTHNYGNFIFTLFFYPIYLALFYAAQHFVLRKVTRRETLIFAFTYLIGGAIPLWQTAFYTYLLIPYFGYLRSLRHLNAKPAS